MDTGDQHPDIDSRSELLFRFTRENVAGVTASWPVTAGIPPDVQELLAESRRLFVGATVSYDNFAASSLKALQAADLALKLLLGFKPTKKMTMGQLISFEADHPVLDPETREWYSEFALRFRNKLSHPRGSVAFTAGLAEPILRTCHERVAQLFTS